LLWVVASGLLLGMGDHSSSQREPGRAVEIRTPARLHLGMLSFGNPAIRSFGGVGVMVDRPGVVLRMRRAEKFEAKGPHSDRAMQFARQAAAAWSLGDAACAIDVVSAPRSHIGLGSGTQLALAVAAGVRHLFRRSEAEPPHEFEVHPAPDEWLFDTHDVLELAAAVGRGRRSCVGIYGFSRGGLIVEAGRAAPVADGGFSPMVARVRLPSSWRCVVIAQRDSVGLHGDAEKEAFARLAPMPIEITAEMSRIALMDILPAAVESRFAEFSDAIHRYGQLAGKPFEPESERLPHARATATLIELLGELGVRGAAQSSWGPTVMACCDSLDAAGSLLDQFETLGLTRQYEATIARFDTQGAVLLEIDKA
jgi:beta-ribofuranosylaminobenzene 5'-phosphate synthase